MNESKTTPREALFAAIMRTSTLGRDDRNEAWRKAIAEALDAARQEGEQDLTLAYMVGFQKGKESKG